LAERKELSHAGPETVNREAELTAPIGVGSSDMLRNSFMSKQIRSRSVAHPYKKRGLSQSNHYAHKNRHHLPVRHTRQGEPHLLAKPLLLARLPASTTCRFLDVACLV
jgi:hypothetical protein